jgi:hypothetical protein
MRTKNNRKLQALLFPLLLLLEYETRARHQFPGPPAIINSQPSSSFANQRPKTTSRPAISVNAELRVRTTIKRAMRTKNNRKRKVLLFPLLLLEYETRARPQFPGPLAIINSQPSSSFVNQ